MMNRGRVGSPKCGWWPGLGFVSMGFRKTSRGADGVGGRLGVFEDIGNIDPRLERNQVKD